MKVLRMGTRGSALALTQARWVARRIEAANPGWKVEEQIIRTTGDKQQGAPLPQIGGKGLFTLEIEQGLLNGEIDFAVHSLKDLPPVMPEGLILAAVPERENPCDALLLHPINIPSPDIGELPLKILPLDARVGTSSLRRRAMLLHLRPDLRVESVRGNIDTRIRKLEEEGFHAIVLARAGLSRLEAGTEVESINLPESWFIPAPGQGALAIQSRRDDLDTRSVLLGIEDTATRNAVEAERALIAELNAGCTTPLGALARCYGDTLTLNAAVLSQDGKERIAVTIEGAGDPQTIGRLAAKSLLDKGAAVLLAEGETGE